MEVKGKTSPLYNSPIIDWEDSFILDFKVPLHICQVDSLTILVTQMPFGTGMR
jgi:hypothetical protein